MTSTADSPESPMSLDSGFTPLTREQWIETAIAGLDSDKTGDEALQELRRTTLEGIPLELLYDSAESSFQTIPASAHSKTWDNRLSVECSDEHDTNQSILAGLAGGITSIELHTANAADIAPSLSGVQLSLATVSLRSGQHYQACSDELFRVAAAQSIDAAQLTCALNADPIGSYLRGGDDALADALAQMAVFAKASSQRKPKAGSILVDASIHHNAGASTVEELHAALATATLYLETMLDAGMSADAASRQITFQVGMDADVLIGVAKIRALRVLWQHIVQQLDSNAKHSKPAALVAETSRRCCSTLEPWNNHLRNLAAGTAALLGGADTLIVHPHDALQRAADKTDSAVGDRMARNIAIILERECGLRKVYDPMAGSYAIENLTQQLMQQAWQSLASTDTSEGWLDELTSGRWQTRLTHTHQQRMTLLENEQRIAIGVNRFVLTEPDVPSIATSAFQDDTPRLQPVRDAEEFEQRALAGAKS